MNFSNIMWNQNMVKILNFVMWTQTASLFIKKTDNIYKDIAEGVDARTDTSYFELKRPLPEGKIKK